MLYACCGLRLFARGSFTTDGVKIIAFIRNHSNRLIGVGIKVFDLSRFDAYILKSEKTRLCQGSGARLLRREVTVGEICLNFLLQEDEKTLYAEIKCCTLVAGCAAYLPEALSQRLEQDFCFYPKSLQQVKIEQADTRTAKKRSPFTFSSKIDEKPR